MEPEAVALCRSSSSSSSSRGGGGGRWWCDEMRDIAADAVGGLQKRFS